MSDRPSGGDEAGGNRTDRDRRTDRDGARADDADRAPGERDRAPGDVDRRTPDDGNGDHRTARDGRAPLRVVATGATGRMGRTVLRVAGERPDVDPVAGLAPDPPDAVAGVPVEPVADAGRVLADREPDAVVDFSAPSGAVACADACAEAGVAFVSGTTGLDGAQRRRVEGVAGAVPVLRASNFSRGAVVLRRVVREAVERLPGYDVEVVETHHAGKRDAPSGTALDLVGAVESVRGERGRVHGREGEAPRGGEVGVHAVRAGDVTGDHAVVLAGADELLRLEHRAGDRRAFAAGALAAARAVAGRPPGQYSFPDLLGDGLPGADGDGRGPSGGGGGD